MADSNQDAVLRVLEQTQAQLSSFARKCYPLDGRGVIQVQVPALPADGATAQVSTEMKYHKLEEIRTALSAQLQGEPREEAKILIHMLETYDPETQAVVTVAIGLGNPVSVKLRLQ